MHPVVCLVVALAAQAPIAPVDAPAVVASEPLPVVTTALAPQVLAILPVTADQIPLDELIVLQGAVRAEAAALGVQVQDESETSAHLGAARKIGAACQRKSADCMTKVGLLADATQVLAPTATARGEGIVLDLRLVDVELGIEVEHVVVLLPGDDDARRRRIADLVQRALRPSTTRTQILVDVTTRDARIFVDGEDRGLSPSPDAFEVTAGEHRVEVTKAGFHKYAATLQLRPREQMPLLVDLEAMPKVAPPPPPSAAVRAQNIVGGLFAGGGIGVCGTAVGCLTLIPVPIFLATGYYLQTAEDAYLEDREGARINPWHSPEVVSTFSSTNRTTGTLMVLIGVPGVAVGATIIGLGTWVLLRAVSSEGE